MNKKGKKKRSFSISSFIDYFFSAVMKIMFNGRGVQRNKYLHTDTVINCNNIDLIRFVFQVLMLI